ncbi:MAG: energy transducer TonB [Chitinophagaceae bacterium]|nr:energy transducer TonB [Chitinophagaceae bacterium]
MKLILVISILLSFSRVHSQNEITKYYDGEWNETSKDLATFYADFVKDGPYYQCTSYWIKTKLVRGKTIQKDTAFGMPIGLQLMYYENGNLSDSVLVNDGITQFSYHYFPDGKLNGKFLRGPGPNKNIIEGYDESGNKIKNYIFEREAEFKSGPSGWAKYINKSATKDFPAKGSQDERVTVVIQFIVDKDGEVTNAKVRQSSGHKNVDEDALQIIQGSPQWKNAVLFNNPVNAYRLQPITYLLIGKKSEKK